MPVSLCGQMSSHPLHTMLLIGLGLRKFSVAAHSILEIKKVCRSVTVQQCEALAKRALEMDHARDVQALLREQLIKLIPAFSRIM